MIHAGSAPATLPQYNIFKLPDTQTAAQGRTYVTVYPTAPATMNSVIQFNVSGAGKDYTDTDNSVMHMTLKYTKIAIPANRRRRDIASGTKRNGAKRNKRTASSEGVNKPAGSDSGDGSDQETDSKPDGNKPPTPSEANNQHENDLYETQGGSPPDLIYPINLIHHTAFRQIDVEANNINLIKANNLNPYESLFKVLLRYGTDAKETHLKGMGYYTEEPDMLDDLQLDGRLSVLKRWFLYSDSKTVDLEGPLLLDAFQLQGRPLLNGVNLTLKFYPSDKAFFTMCNMDEYEYKVELVDIYLKICKIKVSDAIILAHNAALENTVAVYPFTRCDTKAFTYSQGLSNICVDDIFHYKVPSRIVFGMVSADAFNGNSRKNPFNFKHYNISDIALTVDGINVTGKPLKLDGWPSPAGVNEGRQYVDAYLNLFQVAGTIGKNGGSDITIDHFAKGYSLFAFNLDPELKVGNYMNLVRPGNVRLELRFKKPLPETMVLILYSERFDVFKVDLPRNVILQDS
jgi:hypothetical protein